jgi:hypothetical protein
VGRQVEDPMSKIDLGKVFGRGWICSVCFGLESGVSPQLLSFGWLAAVRNVMCVALKKKGLLCGKRKVQGVL